MDLDRPVAPDPYEALPAVPTFDLTSDDVRTGSTLDEPFVGDDALSPHLAWDGVPDGTRSILVTCFDPDAPSPRGFWHWAVVDLPAALTELPRGAGSPRSTLLPRGAYQLTNDAGTTGYTGAWPPRGDRTHRYFFAVHALDVENLPTDVATEPGDVQHAAVPHTLARAVLVPVFGR